MLTHFSLVQPFVTPWTVALQAPLTMGFSRQECQSGVPFPSAADLPDTGIKPTSLMSPASAGGFFTTSATWEEELAKQDQIRTLPGRQKECCTLMDSPKQQVQIPGTSENNLFGKGVPADVVKLTILRWGGSPELSRWTLKSIPSVLP